MPDGPEMPEIDDADWTDSAGSPDVATVHRIPLRQILTPRGPRLDAQMVAPQVVAPVREPGPPHDPTLLEVDWPHALDMIRDVGARLRQSRRASQETAERSQILVQRSLQQVEAAERRMRTAEATSKAAAIRAEQAELAAQAAEARARRLEEDMQALMKKHAEAQIWLKRLYGCVLTEFDDLIEDRA